MNEMDRLAGIRHKDSDETLLSFEIAYLIQQYKEYKLTHENIIDCA